MESEHSIIAHREVNQRADRNHGQNGMVQSPIQTRFKNILNYVINSPSHSMSPINRVRSMRYFIPKLHLSGRKTLISSFSRIRPAPATRHRSITLADRSQSGPLVEINGTCSSFLELCCTILLISAQRWPNPLI